MDPWRAGSPTTISPSRPISGDTVVPLDAPRLSKIFPTDRRDTQRQTAGTRARIHASDVGHQPWPRQSVAGHARTVWRDGTAATRPAHRGRVPGAIGRRPCPDAARASEHLDRNPSASRIPRTPATAHRSKGCSPRAARSHRAREAVDCSVRRHGGDRHQAIDVDLDGHGAECDAANAVGNRRRVGRLTCRQAKPTAIISIARNLTQLPIPNLQLPEPGRCRESEVGSWELEVGS